LMLFSAYFIMVKWLFRSEITSLPDASLIISEKISSLGKISFQEYGVITVFALTALGWIFRTLISDWFKIPFLNDTIIGIGGSLLLFIIPDVKSKTGFLFDWESMTKLSWGILLLIGGGLTLAKAMETSGVVKLVGNLIAASGIHTYFVVLLMLVTVILILKQFIGNTALASIALPMVAGVAQSTGITAILLAAPVTFACSFAFTLPMSTPPNAIVFTTSLVKIKDMLKAGFLLVFVGLLLLLLASWVYGYMI